MYYCYDYCCFTDSVLVLMFYVLYSARCYGNNKSIMKTWKKS